MIEKLLHMLGLLLTVSLMKVSCLWSLDVQISAWLDACLLNTLLSCSFVNQSVRANMTSLSTNPGRFPTTQSTNPLHQCIRTDYFFIFLENEIYISPCYFAKANMIKSVIVCRMYIWLEWIELLFSGGNAVLF